MESSLYGGRGFYYSDSKLVKRLWPSVISRNTIPSESEYRITLFDDEMKPWTHISLDKNESDKLLNGETIYYLDKVGKDGIMQSTIAHKRHIGFLNKPNLFNRLKFKILRKLM